VHELVTININAIFHHVQYDLMMAELR